MKPELIIIGAGLGAESMTLEGLNALKTAEVVLFDRLVHEDTLKLIPESAVKESVGKHPYSRNCIRQDDINSVINKYLTEGRRVVRLKGGDSTLFARSLEEAEEAARCGASCRIIPGVTSASTLASKITRALTDRRSVSGCVFITGHLKDGKCEHNWKALAELGMTIVIYMGVRNGRHIADELIKNGMRPETSAVVGSRLESVDEKICVTTLACLGDVLETGEYPHPSTIIIGNPVG